MQHLSMTVRRTIKSDMQFDVVKTVPELTLAQFSMTSLTHLYIETTSCIIYVYIYTHSRLHSHCLGYKRALR